MRICALLALLGLGVVVFACSSSSPGTDCAAAGGRCVIGDVMCANAAGSDAQDCNPDENPAGDFCCLDLVAN